MIYLFFLANTYSKLVIYIRSLLYYYKNINNFFHFHLDAHTRNHLPKEAKLLIRTLYASLMERGVKAPVKLTAELLKKPYSTLHKIVTQPEDTLKRNVWKKQATIINSLGDN
jgi:hypothetical protein